MPNLRKRLRLNAGKAESENLARSGRAAIIGALMLSALALAGMTCTSADEPPPPVATLTPVGTLAQVAATGLEAMSGRPVTLEGTGSVDRERFIALSIGNFHSCALKEDGRALCWGLDDDRQSSAPEDERFAAISAGGNHTCGLREDGAAICWGRWGESGRAASSLPDERFVAISAGAYHTCGLRESGVAVCWGGISNNNIDRWSPPSSTFISIFSGQHDHTCGIRHDGSSVCWGRSPSDPPESLGPEGLAALSRSGQCGLYISGEINCPDLAGPDHDTFRGEKLRYIGGSWDEQNYGFICGIRPSDSAACWSVSRDRSHDWNISKIPSTQKLLDIGAGFDHACGLLADGSIRCWGDNRDGQASPPLAELGPALSPPSDVICHSGVVIVKGFSCKMPDFTETDERGFAVMPDGLGVVYGAAGEIYETRYVSVDIRVLGIPVLIEDGWFRLEDLRGYSGGRRCEGSGNPEDFVPPTESYKRNVNGGYVISLPGPPNTICTVLTARAYVSGNWIIDKALVWGKTR